MVFDMGKNITEQVGTAIGRTPPTGGSGITIGQRPCAHDYQFLRQYVHRSGHAERPDIESRDVFFCKHCLQYREVALKTK